MADSTAGQCLDSATVTPIASALLGAVLGAGLAALVLWLLVRRSARRVVVSREGGEGEEDEQRGHGGDDQGREGAQRRTDCRSRDGRADSRAHVEHRSGQRCGQRRGVTPEANRERHQHGVRREADQTEQREQRQGGHDVGGEQQESDDCHRRQRDRRVERAVGVPVTVASADLVADEGAGAERHENEWYHLFGEAGSLCQHKGDVAVDRDDAGGDQHARRQRQPQASAPQRCELRADRRSRVAPPVGRARAGRACRRPRRQGRR